MRIHYFMHDEHEDLGCIEHWIRLKGHNLSVSHLYAGDFEFPDMTEFDWLILMGGPMGTYEEDQYPWLKREKEFIKRCIDEEKIVLGICLGSQLIAASLGANVFKNTQQEIGWFPIYKSKEAKKHPVFDFVPDELTVFHWHGDTFDLPQGAVQILSSKITPNQAFTVGNSIIGLQFHYEATKNSIKEMMKTHDGELIIADYVQSKAEILDKAFLADYNNQIMYQILDRISELNTNR